METVKVTVDYEDRVYSEALARALNLCGFDAALGSDDASDGKPERVAVNNESFPFPMPVSAIVNEIMAQAGTRGPADSLNALYTGFTAAIGGGGLTSCALCYAKLRARLGGVKTAFVSFDPWYRNSFPESDEFGVVYLSPAEFEKQDFVCEELVLDIPSLAEGFADLLDMCERRVVVQGFSENRNEVCQRLFEQLSASSARYINAPRNYIFENHFEVSPDSSDIHSQLGKEINELAKRMEKEQT